MDEWVTIIHPETGGTAEVPAESLQHHYASGWRLLAEDEVPQPEPAPEPMTKAQAAKTARQTAAKAQSEEK